MQDEKLDLLDYLPEYLKQYEEFQQIMQTESIELQNLAAWHQNLINDSFITSCGNYGIERYEKMLGITPLANDTLETRKLRVLSRWNNTVPYNYAYLEKQLKTLCGENGYKISLDVNGQTLTVKVELVSKNMLDSVKQFLENIIPCNIVLDVDLLYNQHKTIGKFTHKQLSAYTHKQLREEVIK